MRDTLAELLIATVMEWTHEDVANERPMLQAMAALKYDEYQQFGPGIRFVESLALWLRQFKTDEERSIAYNFVKSRLVFFSAAEIAHLVTIAYPDYIRPLLISRAANAIGIPDLRVEHIARSKEYRILKRQCLFLGLSDGARIDTFRRATSAELSHEQIWQTYEMSPEKSNGMLFELRKDLGSNNGTETQRFRMIFLLDDFSGSGISYCRREGDAITGKIAKFRDQLRLENGLRRLIDLDDLYVCIVLYIATRRARDHMNPLLKELFRCFPRIQYEVRIIQQLEPAVSLDPVRDEGFLRLAEDADYYDSRAETESTKKGGTDVKKGFAKCALPLVLSHNTPNNSMFLLWANPDNLRVHGLFPRVDRHRGET